MLNAERGMDSLSQALLVYLRREWRLPLLEYQSLPKPIVGGFETSIFEFQLRGASGDLSGRLILRLFRGGYEAGRALRESVVQNTVSATGYPAPRVFLTCLDESVLGGEFNVMEKMPGKPMLENPSERLPETLGRIHAALHQIDPNPLKRMLEAQGIDERRFSLQGLFNWIRGRIDSAGYDWLRPGMDWLDENRPEIGRVAICHGDFHPLNILMKDEKVSGVLDWSGFRITDPALDVAFTKVIISIPAPVLVSGFVSEEFVERYLSAYQRELPVSHESLEYFEALRCVMALLEGADGQVVWRHPDILTQVLEHLYACAGLRIKRPSYS